MAHKIVNELCDFFVEVVFKRYGTGLKCIHVTSHLITVQPFIGNQILHLQQRVVVAGYNSATDEMGIRDGQLLLGVTTELLDLLITRRSETAGFNAENDSQSILMGYLRIGVQYFSQVRFTESVIPEY